MKWEIFTDIYCSNFGRLTEADGLREWAAFVTNEVRDEQILRTALQPYIDRFAAALDKLEPVPRKPMLGQIRRAYYAELRKLREESDKRRFGEVTHCATCRGNHRVFVLAPLSEDGERKRWPEDFRTAEWSRFRGVELALCPSCSGDYPIELGCRITDHCAPFSVRSGDPDWPFWVDEWCDRRGYRRLAAISGDQVITSWMRRNAIRREEESEEVVK